jgi:hypothetical protein
MRQGDRGAARTTVIPRPFFTVHDRLVKASAGLLEGMIVGHIG